MAPDTKWIFPHLNPPLRVRGWVIRPPRNPPKTSQLGKTRRGLPSFDIDKAGLHATDLLLNYKSESRAGQATPPSMPIFVLSPAWTPVSDSHVCCRDERESLAVGDDDDSFGSSHAAQSSRVAGIVCSAVIWQLPTEMK